MKKLRKIITLFTASLLMLTGCNSTEEHTTEAKLLPKISVQLFSVRKVVQTDFKDTLTQLAAMGFQGVEFAGKFGPYKNDPKGLKTFLDSLNLEATGAHVSFKQLNEENFTKTVEFYKAIGVKILIVGYDARAWHPKRIQKLADDLNAQADKLALHGMLMGYHNHAKEFNDFNGETFWDYLAQHTKQNVVLQQDVGWTSIAGKNPIDYVKRYPGRTITTHYKVMLPKPNPNNVSPIIGQDNIVDWSNLIKANIEVGGTEWLVIEQEAYPKGLTPLQSVAQSKVGLDKFIQQL